MERVGHPSCPEDSGPPPVDPDSQSGRRPYEAPRLICYGHVKTLTAGTKLGINDISLNSSIV